jgi:hypothetical protein
MSSRAKWTVLALSLAGGCLDHTPLGPGADVVVVHAVLNPTRSVQHVDVRHSMIDQVDLARGIPVHGATVTLTAPDGSVHVAPEVLTPGDPGDTLNYGARYDVDLGALTVGTPYHLRVVTADGTVTEGDAIVPAAPPLNAMAERRFDPATDTLRFAWPRAAGARAYEVRIIPQLDSSNVIFTDPSSGQPYYYAYVGDFLAYVDTSVTIAGTARRRSTPVFEPGGRYIAIVSAVDDHYYDYFSHESDPYTDTPLPSSLRGGVGVFGAIVPIVWQSIVVEGSSGGR